MSSEIGVENTSTAEVVPESEATAAPITEEVQQTDETPPKTFTQSELDAILAKNLAKAQRKWNREHKQPEQVAPALVADPEADPSETPDVETLVQREIERREKLKERTALLEAYHDREESARDKYDDFEQVAYNPKLSISEVMAQTIQASDIGPDLIYHLGSNPKEADRISKLPPFLQAKEIGRIEATLAAAPPAKRTSAAPAPIEPVTPRANNGAVYDTTDPRAIKSMTTSEWIEAERQRQIKKAGARN